MRTIIIEDEKKSLLHLKGMLTKYFTQVEIVATASTAMEAISKIHLLKPDLLLLDINLPDRSGLEMLAALESLPFDVVFVTAFEQYAMQAIKLSALDYLLKPVSLEDLSKAVVKAEAKHQKQQMQQQLANLMDLMSRQDKKDHRIALPLMHETKLVAVSDIVRCEAVNNYTMFHLTDATQLLVTRGIFEYDELLRIYNFLRVSKSDIVNMYYVKSLLKKDAIYELLLHNKTRVHISRLKLDAVKERMLKKV